MEWVYNDGGRAAAGYKGTAGDCVCRAIAIATERPYQEVYDLINEYAKSERTGKRKRDKSSARNGVYKQTIQKVMAHYGWRWIPTMQIGQGCKVHLNENELPSGRLVVSVSKHETAVIDGVLNDTYDCTRDGTRCVYGYYVKEQIDERNEVPIKKKQYLIKFTYFNTSTKETGTYTAYKLCEPEKIKDHFIELCRYYNGLSYVKNLKACCEEIIETRATGLKI